MSTYAKLKSDIADWLMRSDLTDVIPTFIANGESRINKRIRHRLMETTASMSFDQNGVTSLPDDFLEVRSLEVVSGSLRIPLEHVEPDSAEWLFKHRPSTPKYFTMVATDVVTRPLFTGTGTLNYYARIPSLSNAEPTNWLLDKFPEVYLYGALIEGAVYLRDQPLLAHFAELFNDSTQGVLTDRRLSQVSRAEGPPAQLAAETRDQLKAL